MLDLLKAYAVLGFCGWAVHPALRRLCGPLPDRGYSLGRCVGWILAARLSWLLADVFEVPLNTPIALGAIGVVAAIIRGPGWLRRLRPGRERAPHGTPGPGVAWGFVVGAEILFLCGLLLFHDLLRHNPSVDPDSERFMDYAFLKTLLRTSDLPLQDPWLAGEKAAYYHFGYALSAFLVRACGSEPAQFFTAAVAAPFALLWAAAFGVGAALTGRARGGLAAAFLVLGAGNFDWLRRGGEAFRAATFDWFAGSRAIEGAITEFPWFSLLWGDLHPYVISLPIVVCALGLVLAGVLDQPGGPGPPRERVRLAAGRAALLAFLLGAALATHPWDYPLLLGTAAVLVVFVPERDRGARLAALALAAAAAWFLYRPFLSGLAFSGRSIGWVPDRSAPTEWLMAHGPFAALLLLGLPLVLLAGRPRASVRLRAAAVCASAGLAIAAACEVVYVRDLFETTSLMRMNTIFKLHRYVWILLALAGAWMIDRLLAPAIEGGAAEAGGTAPGAAGASQSPESAERRARLAAGAGRGLVLLVLASSLVYPVLGTAAWLRVRRAAGEPGGDAESTFRRLFPGDAAAAAYLAKAAGPRDALVEETGEPYTWSSRIATFSGVPTVLGWGNHEAVWRGGWDEVRRRTADIALIYARPGSPEACARLREHGVRWIVAGDLERRRYGTDVGRLSALAAPVFERDGTAIYATGDVCGGPR